MVSRQKMGEGNMTPDESFFFAGIVIAGVIVVIVYLVGAER